jgi:uroporphyrinogen-III synthase
MKRVLVLRAREDAERTALALRAAGFEPVLSPALEIVPTHAALPAGPFDAVLATSAKAAQNLPPLSGATLDVVGARTAEVAARLGWRVDLVAADAAELARALCARHAGVPARFLYLAGHDRRAVLETALREAGHEIEVAALYEAVAATALAPMACDAIEKSKIFATAHFSRRSAEIFVRLVAREGLTRRLCEMRHLAISDDAATPIRAAGVAVAVAEAPNEKGVMAALAKIARNAGAGA